MLDPNPLFWERWEHLGLSVVKQAIEDYAYLQKQLHGVWVAKDKDGYQPKEEEIEKFMKSKYYAYICPRFDGWKLYDYLKAGGWRNIPRMQNHARPATYQVGDWGKYTGKPIQKRGTKPKPSRFGIKREGGGDGLQMEP